MKVCRKEMDLSVTRMAQLIGVSRSLLSLYEAGKRNLPAKASLLKTRIEQLWIEISTLPVKEPARLNRFLQELENDIDEKLQWELATAERKLTLLNRAIEKVPGNYEKEILRYSFLETLADLARLTKLRPALEKSRLTRERNLEACSPAKQRWLQYQLELAKAQKELVLKWGMKPVVKTKTARGKLREIKTSSKTVKAVKKDK